MNELPIEETDLATARESLVGAPMWRLAVAAAENGESLDPILQEALDFAIPLKVDNYAAVMKRMAIRKSVIDAEIAAINKQEIALLQGESENLTKALETVKDRALGAMKIMGAKKLEGNTSTLKALGVAPSCEVYDEALVPDEFKTVNVSTNMPMSEWKRLTKGNTLQFTVKADFDPRNPFVVKTSIDKAAVLKALKGTCQACGGNGKLCVQTINPDGSRELVTLYDPCAECRGTGKRQIPGARLVDQKTRLEVS